MPVPLINGRELSWADVKVLIEGVLITGVTAIKYDDEQEIEDHYGSGEYPVSRGYGKIKATASITLLASEIVMLQKSVASRRLQDIGPFSIEVCYLNGTTLVTDRLRNCQFMKNARDSKTGDMKVEVEIPLIVSHIEWNV